MLVDSVLLKSNITSGLVGWLVFWSACYFGSYCERNVKIFKQDCFPFSFLFAFIYFEALLLSICMCVCVYVTLNIL